MSTNKKEESDENNSLWTGDYTLPPWIHRDSTNNHTIRNRPIIILYKWEVIDKVINLAAATLVLQSPFQQH